MKKEMIMFKRVSVFFLFCLILNGESIVSVRIGKDRLEPLFKRNLHIVCELENYAIITADGKLQNLQGLEYRILEEKRDERYYLVRVLDKNIDLSGYGRILLKDNDIYFIATNEDGFFNLKKERVFIRYITFEPIVKRDIRFDRKFQYNPVIQEIVNNVNPDSVLSFVRRLQNFKSRFSTYDSTFYAALWIGSKLYEYGCDTVIYQTHTSGHAPNVIGIKYGTLYPSNRYSIISSHFDAYSNQIPTFVPGADDNASGTAGVIECARVLKDYRFEYTIKFIAFSGEEFGLFGSEYYAQLANQTGDSILGVVNADMIGYVDHLPESVDVVTNNASIPFADYFIECANNYTTLKTLKYVSNWASWSDHAPFWDYGYNAFCLIEDENVPNPFYHTIGDTIGGGYNNNLFATEVIKGEVATIASLSVISRAPDSPNPPSLLSPFDCANIPDIKPVLVFTSSDPDNDRLVYRILLDEEPDFSSPEIIETPLYESNDTVSFQIPNSLNSGNTYYWKVICKDPEGSNFWSDYSDRYSFTISNNIPDFTCSFFLGCSTQFKNSDLNGLKIYDNKIYLDSISYIHDTLLYEDFESGIPSDWAINDGNGDNVEWEVGTNNYLLYFIPPSYGNQYAYYCDRNAGNYVLNTAEEIISPKIYIPQGGISVCISYGYGIRINQEGEKMQLKYRRFTTTWLTWIINYTHNISSSGERTTEINLSITSMESLQVKWTYTDQSSSNHYGYTCAIDNPTIYLKIPTFITNGVLTTGEISFYRLNYIYPRDNWGDIIIRKLSAEDSIGIQVEHRSCTGWKLIPDAYLPNNSTGIFLNNIMDTISLSSVPPTTYDRIRVKVIFKRYSTKSSGNPGLISLEVGNLSRYVGIENEKEKIFSISKNVFSDLVEIKWNLKKETEVKVNLYDITGRNVYEIFNGKSGIGEQKIKFIPEDKIRTGVYFLIFETEDFKQIKKLIYIK